jgi:uncharacterized protein (DUF2235 family)
VLNHGVQDRVVAQDVKQVWFSGVRCDVGGGYPEQESGIPKYPLLWMIEKAKQHGLKVKSANINQLAWGGRESGARSIMFRPTLHVPCITR